MAIRAAVLEALASPARSCRASRTGCTSCRGRVAVHLHLSLHGRPIVAEVLSDRGPLRTRNILAAGGFFGGSKEASRI